MSYTVTVARSDGLWIADVEGLPGAHTYAGNLTALDEAVQEVIALVLDAPENTQRFDVHYDYSNVDEPLQRAALIGLEREQVERRQGQLKVASAIQIAKAAAAGHSVRTISATLKMSPGRVTQIVQETDPQAALPTWLVADKSDGTVHSWHFAEEDAENARAGDPSKYAREVEHTATGWL